MILHPVVKVGSSQAKRDSSGGHRLRLDAMCPTGNLHKCQLLQEYVGVFKRAGYLILPYSIPAIFLFFFPPRLLLCHLVATVGRNGSDIASSGCSGTRLDPNIGCQNRCQKDCQTECQNICQIEMREKNVRIDMQYMFPDVFLEIRIVWQGGDHSKQEIL